MSKSEPASDLSSSNLRVTLDDALRYWERRRIIYNLLLMAVVVTWIAATWPHFRPAFTWSSLFALAVLALLANLCYCTAYIVDLPLQFSSFRNLWCRWRWTLFLVGTLFAVLFANYWIADEIYSFVPNLH
jgi:hypothetical protein